MKTGGEFGDPTSQGKPDEVPGSQDQSDSLVEELLAAAFAELSHDSSWSEYVETDWEGYYMGCTLRAQFSQILKKRGKRK